MEHRETATLAQEIARSPLPVQELLRCAIDLATAVNHFHRQGRAHGGMEPAGILLGPSGLELAEPAPGPLAVTPYTAPEQFLGVTDARGDIFAFGAVLYEMATGWKAFAGNCPDDLKAAILEKQPPPIAALQGDPAAATFYAALDKVVASCLVKNPDRRRQRMQNVLVDLKLMSSTARAVPARPPLAPPPPTPPRQTLAKSLEPRTADVPPPSAAPSAVPVLFEAGDRPALPAMPQPAPLTVEPVLSRPPEDDSKAPYFAAEIGPESPAAVEPDAWPAVTASHAELDVRPARPVPGVAKTDASALSTVPAPVLESSPGIVGGASMSVAKPLPGPAPSPAVAAAGPSGTAPQAAAFPQTGSPIPHQMQLSSQALEEAEIEAPPQPEPGAVERQASEILSRVGFGQPAPSDPVAKRKSAKEVKEQQEEPEKGATPAESAPAANGHKRNWGRVLKVAAIVAAAAVLAVAAATAVLALAGVATNTFRRKPANPLGVLRFALPAPEQASYLSSPAISPDGKLLAFSAVSPEKRRLLWIRPLSSLKATPLDQTDDALAPFWSPDGKSIGFFAGKKLKKIAVTGGSPVVLCDTDGLAGGGSWSQNGVIVFGRGFYDGLYRVPAAGGAAEHLTRLDSSRGERAHLWPLFLPDGQHFLFYALSDQEDNNGISVGSLGSKDTRHLLGSDTNGIYAELAPAGSSSRTGYLLFAHGHRLTARPFDAAKLVFMGEPLTVAEEINYLEIINLLPISASSNGLLAYQNIDAPKRQLVWLDRAGNQSGVLGEPAEYGQARISPDGTQVAVNRLTAGKDTADIWLFDLETNRPSQFTSEATHEGAPVWSPDGRQLAYFSNPSGHFDLFRKGVGPSAKQEKLISSDQDKYPNAWSPDGKYLLFGSIGGRTNSDLWILPVKGKGEPSVYLQTVSSEGYGQFSPDGKWIAYQSDEGGRAEVYVEAFPRPHAESKRWQISTEGGGLPKWRGDGKEIYYMMNNGKMMAVTVNPRGALSPSAPRMLFQTRALPRTWNLYDATPDGQRFLVNAPVEWASSSPITVVANWTEDFKKQ